MRLLPRIALTTLLASTTIMLTSCVCGDAVVKEVATYYKLSERTEVFPILAVSGKTISHRTFGTFDIAEIKYNTPYENTDKDATLEFSKDGFCVITDKETNKKYEFKFLAYGGPEKSTAIGFRW